MKTLFVLLLCAISIPVLSQRLPDFEFEAFGGSKVNQSVLQKGQPVIVVYFDPFCDHCEELASSMKNYFADLRKLNMVWVSWADNEDNEEFRKKYFSGLETVKVCKDYQYSIDEWFGYSEVPNIRCYNTQWQLTASFSEIKPIRQILDAVK